VPVHCWNIVNSRSVPAGAAAEHVLTHDTSFARHVAATHDATLTHAGSFGQAVEPAQHAEAMQLAHDEPGAVKIWLAPVHDPASTKTTTPVSGIPASRGGEVLPPDPGVVQGTPLTGLQLPSSGGFEDDEQATSAPSVPASSVTPTRTSAPGVRLRAVPKDERKAMAKVFLGCGRRECQVPMLR
jgi:hypothetical protein